MKSFLCLVALLFCAVRSEAVTQTSFPFYLNGDLTWNITEPQAGFRLKGEITNISAGGSGSVRLVLWASKYEYPPTIPNTANAINVAEYPLGALPAGYKFEDFIVKTPSQMPLLNGTYYFTIALLENVNGIYYNRFLISGGAYQLINGEIKGQKTWTIPNKPVVDPPTKIKPDDIYELSERATGEFNQFPSAWQSHIKLTALTKSTIKFDNGNRDEKVSYTYAVVKTKLQGKNEPTGKLIMTYGKPQNITFKDTVLLYFTGPYSGTYKSTVKGYLFSGELGESTTWGTFKLKN